MYFLSISSDKSKNFKSFSLIKDLHALPPSIFGQQSVLIFPSLILSSQNPYMHSLQKVCKHGFKIKKFLSPINVSKQISHAVYSWFKICNFVLIYSSKKSSAESCLQSMMLTLSNLKVSVMRSCLTYSKISKISYSSCLSSNLEYRHL